MAVPLSAGGARRRLRAIGRACTTFCCAALLGCALGAHAQPAAAPTEASLKAAFVFRFPSYLEWPANAFVDAPFVFSVVEADEVAAQLAEIARGRTLLGRPVVVPSQRNPVDGAQVLFLGKTTPARLRTLIRATQNAPVLVVTEQEGALEQGSVINLVLRDGRVRFEVNLEAAERRGLRLSSRLLALALRVQGQGSVP